jgi:hypothetical protein
MKLFQPNNLSGRSPEFTPVYAQTLTNQIVSLLGEHYDFPPNIVISVFSGANLSSQNFKVETSERKAFLKSRDESLAEKTLAEARLTFALSELGQRMPRIIRSLDGELVTFSSNRCWVLYEFQEGDYFTGKGNELKAAAETFGELSLAAKQLFPPPDFDEEPIPHDLHQLLDQAHTYTAKYPAVAELCAAHHSTILENLSRVNEHQQLLTRRCQPVHLDYHPLNLLMKDESVACIVDLEHLKPYSVASGLGFAAYKLIRQTMVDDGFRELELRECRAVSTWLQGWQKSFPDDRFTITELGLGARSRILKLIHLILDAAFNRNDDRFTNDLEKQIFSLYEVDEIFRKL